jgi:hypothetical protein
MLIHESTIQVGNIIRITKEPKRAKRNGFLLGTEHTIQNPPKGFLNSLMGVWVLNKFGELKPLQFFEYQWTGKVKRIRKK